VTSTILICTLGWFLGWWVLGRLRTVSDLPVPVPAPDVPAAGVTVVIPARNEELSLPNLLGDLERSRPAGCRVVVVDDHSTDRTAEIARSFDFVDLVDAPDLPEGWTGKCWACHTGARSADGDYLVFLDADVRLEEGSLERLVAATDRDGGLLSVQPWHDVERPYEQLSALFNVIALMGTAAGSRRGPTGAFGPVLVTRRADYQAVGGHAEVAAEVVEDLALAQRYRDSGRPVRIVAGRGGVRFRMYPAGPAQVVEGWTKNFASGAGATRPLRLLAIIVWVAGLTSAAGTFVSAAQGSLPFLAAAAIYATYVVQLTAMFRQVGRFGPLTAVCSPVLVVFFFGVFARSLWRTHVRRSVEWRGRTIPLGVTRG
jgi:4,4'-diaponeurosporenoate glycosyltransferase